MNTYFTTTHSFLQNVIILKRLKFHKIQTCSAESTRVGLHFPFSLVVVNAETGAPVNHSHKGKTSAPVLLLLSSFYLAAASRREQREDDICPWEPFGRGR
ncbi:hypothetical protein AVEN_205109-1 [Araneus ventricosus]|uniref:Uncharacterized protein n=1 Tax=Araneus ventricosus TaxID=182803 RepID=A0A4Y2PNN5_ARAVE|nr:hypothetical protein AVEN_205109-1 [Araneus ventricosus]